MIHQKSIHPLVLIILCVGILSPIYAQKPASPEAPPSEAEIEKRRQALVERIEKLGWTREGAGMLGSKAEVAIPKGYRFTSAAGTRQLLKMFDNIPSHKELGMLTTEGLGPWIIFEFDEIGYVKDDDKDALDADKLMETLRAGQEAGNEQRRQMGIEELELLGWAVPPRYNAGTKNLEWATRVRTTGGGGESINYNPRLLGRKGVMEVALVCAPKLGRSIAAWMSSFQSTRPTSVFTTYWMMLPPPGRLLPPPI